MPKQDDATSLSNYANEMSTTKYLQPEKDKKKLSFAVCTELSMSTLEILWHSIWNSSPLVKLRIPSLQSPPPHTWSYVFPVDKEVQQQKQRLCFMTSITNLALINRNLVNTLQLINSVPIIHACQIQSLFCGRVWYVWYNYNLLTHGIASLDKAPNANSKMGHIFHFKFITIKVNWVERMTG